MVNLLQIWVAVVNLHQRSGDGGVSFLFFCFVLFFWVSVFVFCIYFKGCNSSEVALGLTLGEVVMSGNNLCFCWPGFCWCSLWESFGDLRSTHACWSSVCVQILKMLACY